jgi:CO dehydrogenase nickel-insertion accessory protein CooC1
MLVVSDANQKSLEVAKTICRMAKDSEIRQVGLVGNRITGPAQELAVRIFAEKNGISIMGMIPFDQGVSDNGVTGAPIDEGHSPAIRKIIRLADMVESSFRSDADFSGENL